MRKTDNWNEGWSIAAPHAPHTPVALPHTWNNLDGQDGGNNYWRGVYTYHKHFARPAYHQGAEKVYVEFCGVSAIATVSLNGHTLAQHQGGYSTFRVDITDYLQEENLLTVLADNSPNNTVYPQKADFTFFGGIYREVRLLTVNNAHFSLDYYGGSGLKITPSVENGQGKIHLESFVTQQADTQVNVTLLDSEKNIVASGTGTDLTLTIENVHLWHGVQDPYLYTAVATLVQGDEVLDEVCSRFGMRTFSVDADKGFFLNGVSYPLHGVSRHQDHKDLGSAITQEQHRQDMALICEIGANTIRLAHYQHDAFFYDLCDECGMIVWAEIPYISAHMPTGRENTFSQMQELIVQNYNHPSIVTWGLSNEITISPLHKADMLDNHHALQALCQRLDPTRPTSLACYAACSPFHPVAHLSDLLGYNLYLGWYVPGLRLNDWFMRFFHWRWPNRPLGYSEYGAEGMPNLHSARPRRGDHTEEYQAVYHEYMLECFARHPFLWATHAWNMFDFAADARNQGGEPGMNHKGLVTYDRKTKKDSFYLYKAYWSDVPFVHLCGSRYVERTGQHTTVKVYSNQPSVTLYCNGKQVAEKSGSHVFEFCIPLTSEMQLKAVASTCCDTALIRKVSKANPDYKLKKIKSKNWV